VETVIVNKGDENYPKRLLDLAIPPERLYCRGRLELLTLPAVAVVGTRDCTRYGVSVAKELSKQCVENGICVISGGASGIDTAAHSGALEIVGGSAGTISVLGNGHNHCYPTENWELQKQIEREGLVISEFPADFPANKQTFPQRNRIVAALSNAVVVVEADIKSGTMITVGVAKKIKRQVFAVPGSIKCYASNGPNDLIKNQTAQILTRFDDILHFFGSTKQKGRVEKTTLQIGMDEKNVLDILGKDEVHLDEILEKCGMPTQSLMTLLTDMELAGLIEKLPANYVVAK
jgi:DNA processing protein